MRTLIYLGTFPLLRYHSAGSRYASMYDDAAATLADARTRKKLAVQELTYLGSAHSTKHSYL